MRIKELASHIRISLQGARAVEVDGLGTFLRNDEGTISFLSPQGPMIFIAYAAEDSEKAERLYNDFESRGYSPWLDRRKLLPGQNWPRRIEDAIASCDFFVACFSARSVNKRGGFQAEVRFALDCASRVPLDEVFLIPVRLDSCRVPLRIQRETQYVDLFPEWEAGLARIVEIIGSSPQPSAGTAEVPVGDSSKSSKKPDA